MVVRITQACGALTFDSAEETVMIITQETNVQKLSIVVKQMLKPNFHCSARPALLTKVKYTIHPALAALWNEAEEWHLLASDHCDGKYLLFLSTLFYCLHYSNRTFILLSFSAVYGFNVWSPAWLDDHTEMVFDGDEGRKKWLKNHKNKVLNKNGQVSGIDSCASDKWVCCMAFSEFDYLVICLDTSKNEYGNLHHVNTRSKKECYCCTMDDLLLFLVYFIKEAKDKKRVDQSTNSHFKSSARPRSGLTRPLNMVRKAVIDSLVR